MNSYKIISIDGEPEKSNSSYGYWTVPYTHEIPIGDGKNRTFKFFWTKAEAKKWVRRVKSLLGG